MANETETSILIKCKRLFNTGLTRMKIILVNCNFDTEKVILKLDIKQCKIYC